MSLESLDELFKILKDERVAEQRKEIEELRRELDELNKTHYIYKVKGCLGTYLIRSALPMKETFIKNIENHGDKFNCKYKITYEELTDDNDLNGFRKYDDQEIIAYKIFLDDFCIGVANCRMYFYPHVV